MTSVIKQKTNFSVGLTYAKVIVILEPFSKFAVFAFWRIFYEEFSYFWMNIGLRPDINREIIKDAQPLKTVWRFPPELVDHIADFIPRENYAQIHVFGLEDFLPFPLEDLYAFNRQWFYY